MSVEVLKNPDGEIVRRIVDIKTKQNDYCLYLPKTFVPIVCSDKEYLIGYVDGINNAMEQFETEDGIIRVQFSLDSFRFIDKFEHDGVVRRMSDLSKAEYEKMSKDIDEQMEEYFKNKENTKKVDNDILFSVTCRHCGNYYEWKHYSEVPEDPFFCGLCNTLLIDYTYTPDVYFDYNKNPLLDFDCTDTYLKNYFKTLEKEMLKRNEK